MINKKLMIIVILAVAAVGLLAALPVSAKAPAISDITGQLMCQCGCGSTVKECPHAECGVRDTMTAEANQMIASGLSGDAIIQNFVNNYGEQVLAEPPKTGFNLAAWVAPFAAIAVAGVLIYLAMRRWVKRGGQQPVEETPVEKKDEYLNRVEKDLDNFGEGGFR